MILLSGHYIYIKIQIRLLTQNIRTTFSLELLITFCFCFSVFSTKIAEQQYWYGFICVKKMAALSTTFLVQSEFGLCNYVMSKHWCFKYRCLLVVFISVRKPKKNEISKVIRRSSENVVRKFWVSNLIWILVQLNRPRLLLKFHVLEMIRI